MFDNIFGHMRKDADKGGVERGYHYNTGDNNIKQSAHLQSCSFISIDKPMQTIGVQQHSLHLCPRESTLTGAR